MSDSVSFADAVLGAENLSKTFREGERQVSVLQNINFTIHPGERVAILGPSGSGKSTLLHLLGGLDSPSTGEVWVQGKALSTLNEKTRCRLRNEKLGFVYQFHHLLPEFTALENVMMPLMIGKAAKRKAFHLAKDLLCEVGLEARLHHKLNALSGGERQRAAIARALVTQPSCLLADEPTGNLDRKTAAKVYETMIALNQSMGTSLLVVTHDENLANQMDRMLYLSDGGLQAFSN